MDPSKTIGAMSLLVSEMGSVWSLSQRVGDVTNLYPSRRTKHWIGLTVNTFPGFLISQLFSK